MPPFVKTGRMGPHKLDTEINFDTVEGNTVIETWNGDQEGILALANDYLLAGARVRIRNDGALWMATVQIGGIKDGSEEKPVDTYRVKCDYVQEDIWSNPNIIAAAGSDNNAAIWKKDLLEKLAVPTAPDDTDFTGTKLELYVLLLRGTVAHELKRAVLSRARTISLKYSPRAQIDPIEKIYSPAKFVELFAIPADVQTQLPTTPATAPTYTMWGWKERALETEIVRQKGKVIEEREWVFAAWATLPYNVIS